MADRMDTMHMMIIIVSIASVTILVVSLLNIFPLLICPMVDYSFIRNYI